METRTSDLAKVRMTGEAGDARLNREWQLEDTFLVIAKVRVAKVAHSHDAKSNLVREMVANPIEAYIVDAEEGVDIADLLQRVRAQRESELNALLGTQSLFDDPNGENDVFGPDGDDDG